jgi:hypothetical protein
MDNKRITEALLSLASSDENRSEIARLRDVFDAVETALSAGVSRVAILDALHRQGFSMTLKTFDNAIYRIRKRNKQVQEMGDARLAKMHRQNQELAEHNKNRLPVENEATPLTGSHHPDDLTQILSAPVDLVALSKHAKRKK